MVRRFAPRLSPPARAFSFFFFSPFSPLYILLARWGGKRLTRTNLLVPFFSLFAVYCPTRTPSAAAEFFLFGGGWEKKTSTYIRGFSCTLPSVAPYTTATSICPLLLRPSTPPWTRRWQRTAALVSRPGLLTSRMSCRLPWTNSRGTRVTETILYRGPLGSPLRGAWPSLRRLHFHRLPCLMRDVFIFSTNSSPIIIDAPLTSYKTHGRGRMAALGNRIMLILVGIVASCILYWTPALLSTSFAWHQASGIAI